MPDRVGAIDSYERHCSPTEFRTAAFSQLSDYVAVGLAESVQLVEARLLEFEALRATHRLQTRYPLLERQSLPYFLTAAVCGKSPNQLDPRILAGCLMGHTLALTHLDYHLDGALPDADVEVSAVAVPAETAVSYALRMVYAASAVLAEAPRGPLVARQAMDPISGFVIARMHEDWHERYDLSVLQRETSKSYLHSPRSRAVASGYWELMGRAGFIEASGHADFPSWLIEFFDCLRRLRQVVDETADVVEDLQSGLLTYPTLLCLELGDAGLVTEELDCVWNRKAPEVRRHQALDRLVALTRRSKVQQRIAQTVDSLAAGARRALSAADGDAECLAVLIDIKLAKFDGLSDTRMTNDGQTTAPALASTP